MNRRKWLGTIAGVILGRKVVAAMGFESEVSTTTRNELQDIRLTAPPLNSKAKRQRVSQQPMSSGKDLPWYRRVLVGVEVGPTGANYKDQIYMARASGKEIVRNIIKAQAQYLVIFTKDQTFAYYNSKIAPKCPNLGDRDLLQECLDEAKKYGLPVIAYVQVQYDTSSWIANPEWRMKDNEGKEIPGRLCYNSGYLEFVKQILGELMAYDISGFHIDMLDFGFFPPYGCWCERCQKRFRQEYGMDMPSAVTWDEAWEKMLEFRYNSNTRFCQELQNFVRSKRPELSVDFNYHGYPPFSWWVGQRPVQHAQNGDFVTAEGLPGVFGHTNPSLLSLFMAGARPNSVIQGVTWRGVYDYHDFTVRPVADLKWEVFTYLAHGAVCTIVDKANYDGTLDTVAYERIGEVFSEALAKRDYFGHKPVPEVGLYYSHRTRDWFGREDPTKYMAAFLGAHKALMQSHITMGILMDENISLERLSEFPVVYLPNVAVLTDEEIAVLDEYVCKGGNLLVTGLTGCYNRYGQPQKRCSLEHLIGAQLVEIFTAHNDNYIRLPKELSRGKGRFLLKDIPSDWAILTYGPVAIFKPKSAQAFGELLTAYRSQDNPWMNHMSPEKVVGSVVLLNRYGKGKVICVPCCPDAAFIGNYRMPEHRSFIRNLIRYLHPKPPFLVNAPLNVEIVVTRDEKRNRFLIHFLCFSGPPTATAAPFPQGRQVLPTLMEEPMHYEAQVAVNISFSSVKAFGHRTKIYRKGNLIRVEVSSVHEVLIIQ